MTTNIYTILIIKLVKRELKNKIRKYNRLIDLQPKDIQGQKCRFDYIILLKRFLEIYDVYTKITIKEDKLYVEYL